MQGLIISNRINHSSLSPNLQSDYDLIDYLNELREGILEGYQGIIQGLKGDGEVANPEVELVKPYVQNIISFIEQVAQVCNKSFYVSKF